jgi:hypothetical protein
VPRDHPSVSSLSAARKCEFQSRDFFLGLAARHTVDIDAGLAGATVKLGGGAAPAVGRGAPVGTAGALTSVRGAPFVDFETGGS